MFLKIFTFLLKILKFIETFEKNVTSKNCKIFRNI